MHVHWNYCLNAGQKKPISSERIINAFFLAPYAIVTYNRRRDVLPFLKSLPTHGLHPITQFWTRTPSLLPSYRGQDTDSIANAFRSECGFHVNVDGRHSSHVFYPGWTAFTEYTGIARLWHGPDRAFGIKLCRRFRQGLVGMLSIGWWQEVIDCSDELPATWALLCPVSGQDDKKAHYLIDTVDSDMFLHHGDNY